MSGAYYNDNDPFAAGWTRNLIAAGLLPDGDVDERSIEEVSADELRGYTQVHLFCGINGWPLALRLAGWPDDRPVWSGSCPCQPLSSAGQRKGAADRRHLWPAFFELVAECKPSVVFGEQVASNLGREWFAGVRADLEAIGYACGGANLPAAGVGAPHIRARLWWVAYTKRGAAERQQRLQLAGTAPEGQGKAWQQRLRADVSNGSATYPPGTLGDESGHRYGCVGDCGLSAHCCGGSVCFDPNRCDGQPGHCWLADAGCRCRTHTGLACSAGEVGEAAEGQSPSPSGDCGMDHTDGPGLQGHSGHVTDEDQPDRHDAGEKRPPAATGSGHQGMEHSDRQRLECREGLHPRPGGQGEAPFDQWWADAVWLPCADGKARRVEPSIQPLAHGVPYRVGQLRAYGNAIVPQLAAAFIIAAEEARADA